MSGLIPCFSEIVLNAVIPWPDREDMEICLGQNSKDYTYNIKTSLLLAKANLRQLVHNTARQA